ncbi:glycoside hydrolase family 71 protein [Frigoribacterium sp. UYMn621]|uniref:glycoside hydrolase family 71 protein n=1 Tax=Frigoribacterium sp. UYMn621 TaxID=3156343 RepID=UPI0033941400
MAFAIAKSNSSAKKVFAHYFPPYPISFDNKPAASDYYARNYLTATGEGGVHALSGGLLRDRPEGRDPLPGDWQLADMKSEVNAAADAGIDGFNVDILSLGGDNWNRTVLLMKAAEQSGRHFTIVPNLDATASAGKSDINTVAAKLAELYAYSSAYKLPTGEYVLSSFAAERQSPAWWTQLKNTLSTRYGVKTAFIAILLSPSDSNLKAFAPISYAIGDWGTRTAQTVKDAPAYAAKVHALGVKWMAPVAIQDERPRSFLYAEASNTETLRASWDRAESDGADLVQLVTWNDYSEGTSFAPSAGHGDSFLDINAFYATRFKTGAAPAVTGDAIYITNRIQAFGAVPSTVQQLMAPTLSGTTVKPRDSVEVLTFLAKSAVVTVTIGNTTSTYTAPAGASTKTFPIAIGGISVVAERAGTQVAKVVSTHPIVAKPLVQDLAYYANSSREQ